jgi:Zn-dependent protease
MKVLLALLLAGKLGKVLLSGGTMLLSIVAYSFVYGWRYSVGLVFMLFVHEMGHYLVARRHGLSVGAPMFIPFVGAWVALKDKFPDAQSQANVAIAGPLLGSAASLVCYLWGLSEGSHLLLAIAYGGFFLNLFNLMPLMPLDGGRVVAAISPKLWLLGVPLLCGFFLWKPSPLLLLIALVAAPEVWKVFKGTASTEHLSVPALVRFQFGAQYLLLAAGLAILMLDVHERLPTI